MGSEISYSDKQVRVTNSFKRQPRDLKKRYFCCYSNEENDEISCKGIKQEIGYSLSLCPRMG